MDAAERGVAGRIFLDWSNAVGQLPALIGQFTRTGHYQREGCGPAAVAVVIGRNLRRIEAEVTRPGRNYDRPWIEADRGTEADISNPALFRFVATVVDALREELKLPVLVLLSPEVMPATLDRVLRGQLERLAAPGVCVAVISDHPGFRPVNGSAAGLIPMLDAVPDPRDMVPADGATR
jgi:hypothetical protein